MIWESLVSKVGILEIQVALDMIWFLIEEIGFERFGLWIWILLTTAQILDKPQIVGFEIILMNGLSTSNLILETDLHLERLEVLLMNWDEVLMIQEAKVLIRATYF